MNAIALYNPRTGEQEGVVQARDREQVQELACALRAAQRSWGASLALRLDAMARWEASMREHSEALAQALIADTGRRMLSYFEVESMCQRIAYWRERAPALLSGTAEQPSRTASNVHYRNDLVPYGLVGVISPWNFPLTLSLVDTIPALAAGAAVLLKPSEVTPRFAEVLAETTRGVEGLEGCLGIAIGDGDTGRAVIDSVDMICFTGSVATGRKVAVQAAENFIPACLELGGKDPAVILADADLDAAADAVLRSAAGSCGQACMAIERVYVQESVFEAFTERLIDRAEGLRFNTPNINRGELTPYIHPQQAEKVRQQLVEAVAQGARIRYGGEPERHGGSWHKPTIVTDVTHEMRLMREETFGPVIPLMPFATDEEAVALANDSDYGLSASVFGSESHAIAVARRIDAGAVGINDASLTAFIHDVEKQSFNRSGLGPSRMGDSGLLRFLRTRALLIQRDRPAPMSMLSEELMPG